MNETIKIPSKSRTAAEWSLLLLFGTAEIATLAHCTAQAPIEEPAQPDHPVEASLVPAPDVPKAVSDSEPAIMEVESQATSDLENKFREDNPKHQGEIKGYILTLPGQEPIEMVSTAAIIIEGQRIVSGGEIFQPVGGEGSSEWRELVPSIVESTVDEVNTMLEEATSDSDKAKLEGLLETIEGIKDDVAQKLAEDENAQKFGITVDDLFSTQTAILNDKDGNPILRESRLIFANENGIIVASYVLAGDINDPHSIESSILSGTEYQIASSSDVMTDGGPLVFMQEKKEMVVFIPASLSGIVAEKEVAFVDEQIIDINSGKVLLEKTDGAWVGAEVKETAVGVVAIAESYGMPHELAIQLEGLDVSFDERPGSVLIKDSEGKILFRVASNEWQNSTSSYTENDKVDAFINSENSVPSSEVSYMGEYWQWAKRELAPQVREYFIAHENEMIDGVEGEENSAMIWTAASGYLIPDRLIKENFSSNELPFSGKKVFHNTTLNITENRTFDSSMGGSITANAGDEWLHYVIPLFLYDRQTQEVSVVVTVTKIPNRSAISIANPMLEQMNVLPLSMTVGNVSGFANPLVEEAFADSGLSAEEIIELMVLFSKGDVTALDGFVLNSNVTDHEVYQ